eukprot:TRINITY_DN21912_c0_g1_i1.p1 TRINITY_DN21912_c0_g1~~TRINITY_DN21912_c0_g1_i1.p1  ORF type:complete len:435 (+),score=98.21 TRINITY_DN21912_c0_g1_i1:54-1358(+)
MPAPSMRCRAGAAGGRLVPLLCGAVLGGGAASLRCPSCAPPPLAARRCRCAPDGESPAQPPASSAAGAGAGAAAQGGSRPPPREQPLAADGMDGAWGAVGGLQREDYAALLRKALEAPAEGLGCADAIPLLTLLRAWLGDAELSSRQPVFLDLGCHVAEFSARALELFGDAALRRLVHVHRLHNVTGAAGTCRPPWWHPVFANTPQTPLSPRLLAAELSPEVHAAAAKRAALEHWDAMGLQVLHRAMADTNRTEVRVQSMPAMPGAGVPEVNSLLLEARGGAAGDAFAVRQVSVDGLLAEQGLGARRVLWMHVDAEGMDAAVLRGAEATLAAGLIDYIDFEYHALWRRKRRRSSEKLRAAVQRLERFGFRCALLLPASSGPSRRLVPLSGPWWHPSYEFHRWSTVWCAHRRNGAVLAAALAFFNAPLQPASRPA